MDMTNGLPVQRNPNAAKYGYATKLIPVFVDGVQTAWEEVHINSKVEVVRRNSPEMLRTMGFRIQFADYDPIAEELARLADRARIGVVYTGD